jgi:hypothetical protein
MILILNAERDTSFSAQKYMLAAEGKARINEMDYHCNPSRDMN